jgi:hypothetical protein
VKMQGRGTAAIRGCLVCMEGLWLIHE